jgi:hypothetical protein
MLGMAQEVVWIAWLNGVLDSQSLNSIRFTVVSAPGF